MKYSADFHFAGCLSEGEGPTLHDSAADAWANLLEIMGDGRWEPMFEGEAHGPQQMTPAALKMEQYERENRTGTVGASGGFYEVDWVADYEAEPVMAEPVMDRGQALVDRMKLLHEKTNRTVIQH